MLEGKVCNVVGRVFGNAPLFCQIYEDGSFIFDCAADNRIHGVDVAEGLRWTTALHRVSGARALVAQAHEGVRLVFAHHGAHSGTITADEQLAGRSPNRGSELCMAVETMFSMAYLYQFHGTNAFADRAERVAFNALPAMMAPDWWAHQYVALANQPWAINTRRTVFANVNGYGTTFGLEPNYVGFWARSRGVEC